MENLYITVILANIAIMSGSILSHAGLWYRIGKIENHLKQLNGNIILKRRKDKNV